MGNIVLSADHGLLDEVVVEGQRATVSEAMEKKTYSIDNNVSQSGGSIPDAMRNLPGVTIDQEGKVILRGSDKVTVLVDGQQSAITGFGNQQGLANIPASNIDRIEIIHNPSARFSASGMAGIINIIYKKDQKSGLTGELGLTVGVGAITKRKDDLPTDLGSFSANPKVIPNLNVNYTGKNLNYFLQTSIIFQESLPNNEFTTRFNESNRVSVFYNRRIDRPGEPELRIFPKYDDPELLKVGNPYLRPQFTKALETAYNHDWSNGSIYLAAFHRIIEAQFLRIYSEERF
jgi:outer membrane cobalamin receptor